MGRLDLKVELLAVGEGGGERQILSIYTILIKMFFINEIYNCNENVYQ